MQIRWYGLVYVLGFLLGGWFLLKARSRLGLSKDDVWDLLFYVVVGVVVGARLFEVFWHPAYYLGDLVNFVKVWQGGMSFHGGFVGVIVAVWLYSKRKKLDFWRIADILSLPAMLALAFGRVANFINGELWGRVFDGSWCVNFRNTGGGDVCRHPSTLYGAAKRFMVAGWLYCLYVRDGFTGGFLFWNFVLFEAVGRFIVDFYREDVLWWMLTIGQWFSLVMVVVAVIVMIMRYRVDWKRVFVA